MLPKLTIRDEYRTYKFFAQRRGARIYSFRKWIKCPF